MALLNWAHPQYGVHYPQRDTLKQGIAQLMTGLGSGLGRAGVGVLAEGTGLKDWLARRQLYRDLYTGEQKALSGAATEGAIRERYGTPLEFPDTRTDMGSATRLARDPAGGPAGEPAGEYDLTKIEPNPAVKYFGERIRQHKFLPKETTELLGKTVKDTPTLSLSDRVLLEKEKGEQSRLTEGVKEKGRVARANRVNALQERALQLSEKLGAGKLADYTSADTARKALTTYRTTNLAQMSDQHLDKMEADLARLEFDMEKSTADLGLREKQLKQAAVLGALNWLKSNLFGGADPKSAPYLAEIERFISSQGEELPLNFINKFSTTPGVSYFDQLINIFKGSGGTTGGAPSPPPAPGPPVAPSRAPSGAPSSQPAAPPFQGTRRALDDLRNRRGISPAELPAERPEELPAEPEELPVAPLPPSSAIKQRMDAVKGEVTREELLRQNRERQAEIERKLEELKRTYRGTFIAP